MLNSADRRVFDEILERTIAALPEHLHRLLEELPLIVEDEPSRRLLADLHMDPRTSELCGLHWGVPLTKRSVEHSGRLPDQMMLFRGPIMRLTADTRRAARRRAGQPPLPSEGPPDLGRGEGLDSSSSGATVRGSDRPVPPPPPDIPPPPPDNAPREIESPLERQIRITLLHEMGHHFGLNEDDLAALGYA